MCTHVRAYTYSPPTINSYYGATSDGAGSGNYGNIAGQSKLNSTEDISERIASSLLPGYGITMQKFSAQQIQLLKEPLIAQLVTIMKDGSPQITPVWVDVDSAGEHILINSEDGRLKLRNIHRDPRVAVGIYDPENPISRVLNVRGRVVEITSDGAYDHIDFLSEKYTGRRPYGGHNPENPRLILKIAADKIDSIL